MSQARASILSRIASALEGGAPAAARGETVAARLADPRPNLLPARGRLELPARIELFLAMAKEVAATFVRLPGIGQAGREIADYLAANGLPMRAAMAPDSRLDQLADSRLELTRGAGADDEAVGITIAFAGVAETGTLVLTGDEATPNRLNYLPDTHIVLLPASRVLPTYEDAWALLRKERGTPPRTVNFITGPSRTGDIEQTILLGAHGPRRLHILLLDEQ